MHPLRAVRLTLSVAAGLLAAAPLAARQIDSAIYFALRRGMSESELIARAGPPDRITELAGERIGRARLGPDGRALEHLEVRRRLRELRYLPDRSEPDPHITVIRVRDGVVWSIERIKVLSPGRLPQARPRATPPLRPARPDPRRERAERVLEAAREYARIRARLKREAQRP